MLFWFVTKVVFFDAVHSLLLDEMMMAVLLTGPFLHTHTTISHMTAVLSMPSAHTQVVPLVVSLPFVGRRDALGGRRHTRNDSSLPRVDGLLDLLASPHQRRKHASPSPSLRAQLDPAAARPQCAAEASRSRTCRPASSLGRMHVLLPIMASLGI